MEQDNEQMQYIMAIVGAVNELFDEESHLKQYNWKNIDLTQFMTAYIKAGNYILHTVSDQEKDNIEFTHFANSLIVQDALKHSKSA